jgi:hypothetical protein
MKPTINTWITLSLIAEIRECRRIAANSLKQVRWWLKHSRPTSGHLRFLFQAAERWKSRIPLYCKQLKENFTNSIVKA